jgi:hypothetical protein
MECRPRIYSGFVRKVAARVRGQLIAQLTVVWSNPCVTADRIVSAWRSVRGDVAGFAMWNKDSDGRPFSEQTAIAVDALSRMT